MSGDLPDGWTWAQLEDLVAAEPRAITDGPFGSNLKTAHYTDSGPRVIRLQNIGDGVFKHEDAHISEEHYITLVRHSVREGDLVVASLGETLPRACLVPSWVPPAIVKADCIRVRLHANVDSSYINFALQRPDLRHQTATQIKGVGRPRLGLKGIRNLAVPLAPLSEQQRIVASIEEHFSRLDAVENVLAETLERLDVLRVSVLLSAFQTDSRCCVDLKTRTIPDLITSDGVFSDGNWIESKDQDPNGDVRLIQLADIGVGEFRNRSNRFLTSQKAVELKCTYLRPEDVLIARMPDPLGRACLLPRALGDCITAVDVAIVRPDSDSIDPTWLMWLINSPAFSRRVASLQSGTTRKRISRKNLAKIEFTVPPRENQEQTAAYIEASFGDVNSLDKSLKLVQARLKALRRSILAEAFAGRLVPQDPADEPASVLLDRISASRATQPKRRRVTA